MTATATGYKPEAAETSPSQLFHGEVYVNREPIDYTFHLPADVVEDQLSVFGPGWGGIKRSSRDLRTALANHGQATLSFSPPRGHNTDSRHSLFAAQALHTAALEAVINDAYTNQEISSATKKADLSLGKLALVSHSMAGLSAVEYSSKHPSNIHSITFLGSPGFGPPKLSDVVMAIPSLIEEIHEYVANGGIEFSAHHLARITHYYARNPLRTLGEGLSCLTTDVRPAVRCLGQIGIHLNYIGFEKDKLVIPHKIDSRDYFDNFIIIPSVGHLAPQNHPNIVASTIVAVQP